jgi:uncharacterized membrane protein
MSNDIWTDGTTPDWNDPSNPWNDHPYVRTGGELTRGEKAADAVRNKMGSWGFVASFLSFMVIWASVNVYWLNNKGFDPYPFILLNLFLSMLAGLQGSILLIAAKRADAIAAEQSTAHLNLSREISEMLQKVERELSTNTRLTHEIHKLHSKIGALLENPNVVKE